MGPQLSKSANDRRDTESLTQKAAMIVKGGISGGDARIYKDGKQAEPMELARLMLK